jgi:beta-lactamase class A
VQEIVGRAVQQALGQFAGKKLEANQMAVTLTDLRDPKQPAQGSHRGGEQIYPASVIKLFYLMAAQRWMEDGKLADTEELRRAMKDMIVDSYNEATGYIVDLLTDTTSGPELPDEIEVWYEKRNAVNRYFAALGYQNINVNRKPWCEGPYGREKQSFNLHKPNHRNWLTTDATARLLTEIVTERSVSPERSRRMMELPSATRSIRKAETQSREYTGSFARGAKLWSKAGWTSETRHDAAYVELPDGHRFVLVVFTVNHANEGNHPDDDAGGNQKSYPMVTLNWGQGRLCNKSSGVCAQTHGSQRTGHCRFCPRYSGTMIGTVQASRWNSGLQSNP